jgi:hypothetical protein
VTIPSVAAVGAQAQTANAGSTSALSVPLPAGVTAGQILLLFVESDVQPINAIAGYTNVGVGTVVQATGLATSLTIRWHLATGSDTAPSVQAAGTQNHLVARIMSVDGCNAAPINGTPATFSDNTTVTSVSIPGGVTTVADCLIVAAFSTGTDVTSTSMVSGWTNASLSSVTEQMDNWHVTGNAGGFGVAVGGLAARGAYSATTATITTGNTKACMSFALAPPYVAPTGDPFTYVAGMRGNGLLY